MILVLSLNNINNNILNLNFIYKNIIINNNKGNGIRPTLILAAKQEPKKRWICTICLLFRTLLKRHDK